MNVRALVDRIKSGPRRISSGWRSAPRVIAWAAVLCAWLVLGIGYLWPQDYRSTSSVYIAISWIGFMGRAMQFNIGLGLLPIALIAAFVTGRRLFLTALPPLVVGLWPCVAEIVLRPEPPVVPASVPAGPRLRLMTANILCSNGESEKFLQVVKEQKPDVIVMQEYTPWWREKTQLALSLEYPYESGFPQADASGIAICSKLPFQGAVRSDIALGIDGRKGLRAVVKIGGQDVAIYTVHPNSPRSVRLYQVHSATFSELREAVALESLPCVVAGDFNFTETTPQHHELLRLGFTEAQSAVGHGRGKTWPADQPVLKFVGIRLDHVYTRDGLVPLRCDVLDHGGSDHSPVIVDIAVTAGR